MKTISIFLIVIFGTLSISAQDNNPKYKLDEYIITPMCSMYGETYTRTSFSYNKNGNLTSRINQESDDGKEWYSSISDSKHEFHYDENGRVQRDIVFGLREVELEGAHWEEEEKVEYIYDENGDLVSYTELSFQYDYETGSSQWIPSENLLFSYQNEGKKVTIKRNSNWDSNEKEWLYQSNNYIVYNDHNQIIERGTIEYEGDPDSESTTKEMLTYNEEGRTLTNEYWMRITPDGEWNLIGRVEDSYDEMGNLVTEVVNYINGETGEITETKIQAKFDFEYDDEERMIAKTIFGPPLGGYIWVENQKLMYTYDENGFTSSISLYSKTSFYIAGVGDVDSLVLSSMENLQYDDHGNKIEVITTLWDEYDNSQSSKTRTTYKYDYNINKTHFKKQFESLNIPEPYLYADPVNEVLDVLLFDDRILVEETTFNYCEESINDMGETEIRWLEPCTEKFIYSRLE